MRCWTPALRGLLIFVGRQTVSVHSGIKMEMRLYFVRGGPHYAPYLSDLIKLQTSIPTFL